MQKELSHVSNLVLFARLVQAGSISKCAESMGVERTTVSRRLKELETTLGVKLLRRSCRQNSITDAGRRCFEQCALILDIVNTVNLATGEIRPDNCSTAIAVGATADIVDCQLESRLARFEENYPDVDVRRHLCSEFDEDTIYRVDLIVAWADSRHRSGLVRELASVRQGLYASPSLLQKRGSPKTPADLRNFPCIANARNDSQSEWTLMTGSSRSTVPANTNFSSRSLLEIRETAVAGFGICRLPTYLGDPLVRYGRLTRVLPDWAVADRKLVTITSKSCTDKPHVTVLRLALEESFRDTPANPDSSRQRQHEKPAGPIIAA